MTGVGMKSLVSSRRSNGALGRSNPLGWLVASASFALAATSCSKDPDPPAPVQVPQAPPKPVDHLAVGELVESDVKAFGLPLPRSFLVITRITQQVSGEVAAQPEDVANYFRARVGSGKITVGTTSTTFSHVRPKADPKRTLDVRVEKAKNGTRVDIFEVIVVDEGPTPTTQADALKKVGLGPNGRPDPQLQ
jgi:hypothetical protein